MNHLDKRISENNMLCILWSILDIVSVFTGGVLSFYYYFGFNEMHDRYKIAMLTISFLTIIFCVYGDFYSCIVRKKWGTLFFKQAFLWVGVGISAAALIYILNVSIRFSRLWFGSTLVLSFLISIFIKFLFLKVIFFVQNKKGLRKKIFIIGERFSLQHIVDQVSQKKFFPFSISATQEINSLMVDRQLDDIALYVERNEINEVWVALPLSQGNEIKKIMHALRFLTVEIRFFPELTDLPLINHRVSEVCGLYSIDLSISPMRGVSRALKRGEDLCIGVLITIMILPVCLIIAVAIKITSPGPILFKQYRTGINGKNFKIYKFRSMCIHTEKDNNVTQAFKSDPRITKVGKFLRRTSLDELPQFFNVLQGRMSIVGPRPHALAHNKYYMDLVESYMQRHKVKPGITGWAQVSGLRGETDTLEKMQERVKFDLWYIENWSILFDLKIIVMTIFKGFLGKNAY